MISPLEQFQKDIKSLLPMHVLMRRTWTFVFEGDLLPAIEEVLIYQELIKWAKALAHQKKIRTEAYGPEALGSDEEGKNGHPLDEIGLLLNHMNTILEKNRIGGFDALIAGIRRAGLQWRRLDLYDINKWFPEYNNFVEKKKGIEAGKEALKENMEEFPEQYPNKDGIIEDTG